MAAGVVTTKADIDRFVHCTLLSAQKRMEQQPTTKDGTNSDEENNSTYNNIDEYIRDVLNFLLEYEFIRKQKITQKDNDDEEYLATRLGKACLCKLYERVFQ